MCNGQKGWDCKVCGQKNKQKSKRCTKCGYGRHTKRNGSSRPIQRETLAIAISSADQE